MLWDPGVLTPHSLAVGVQLCTDLLTFYNAMLLHMACNLYCVLPTVAELCMHADFCSALS